MQKFVRVPQVEKLKKERGGGKGTCPKGYGTVAFRRNVGASEFRGGGGNWWRMCVGPVGEKGVRK